MTFPMINGLRKIEFGNPGESRSKLITFILDGNKRATAGLLWEYEKDDEPLETVGEKLAIVDNDGRHVATLQVTGVEVTAFSQVPDEFALAEAEGDLDGNDFRQSHFTIWSKRGLDIVDDTKIVLVYFAVIADLR
jgi:uncharacterized protein YhfF